MLNSVIVGVDVPESFTLPTLLPLFSVNQRLPSGPTVMPPGRTPLPRSYSVRVFEVVFTLATYPTPLSTNCGRFLIPVTHRLPSGPLTMPVVELLLDRVTG